MSNGIEKIIEKLRNTKRTFIREYLSNDKCGRCLEGVIADRIIPKDILQDHWTLGGLVDSEPVYYGERLKQIYGIEFRDVYDNVVKCVKCNESFKSLEGILTHINDVHAYNHKDNADILEELHKEYDLINGVRK